MDFKHISVLLNESVDALNVRSDGIYVDGTLGGGGHSEQILLKGCGKLIGIDRDQDAIKAAAKRLKDFDNIIYVHNNFKNIKEILLDAGIEKIDGAVIDLGVSSYQIDNADRGFSYMADAPLDMRMDKRDTLSAYDVVNTYEEQRLSKVIYEYGEERFARKIARFIAEQREIKPIETTLELADVIKRAIPYKNKQKGSHEAKRTFQAIRIEVNGELSMLKDAILNFFDCLTSGGRLSIITFHSLEDRIVKQTFLSLAKGCTCPGDFPICVCGNTPKGSLVNRKPIVPSDYETGINKRAKSSKLRIIERL